MTEVHGAPDWYKDLKSSKKNKVDKLMGAAECENEDLTAKLVELTGESSEEIEQFTHWWMEHQSSRKSDATLGTVSLKNIDDESAVEPSDVQLDVAAEENQFGVVNACRIFTRERGYSIEQAKALYTFRYLLGFNACLESIAHGSNDTANATGAFTAVLQSYQGGFTECDKSDSPVWVMAVAGLFVFIGINTYGYNVIKTIGTELVDIDFHRGFYIEFGSTFATIVATMLEFPVSTTHCQIGAVIFVGTYAAGKEKVSWALVAKIIMSWVITLPIAGGIAAIFTSIFKAAL